MHLQQQSMKPATTTSSPTQESTIFTNDSTEYSKPRVIPHTPTQLSPAEKIEAEMALLRKEIIRKTFRADPESKEKALKQLEQAFKKANKSHLILPCLKIIAETHQNRDPDNLRNKYRETQILNPFPDTEFALEEMQAWEQIPEHKNSALDFTCRVLANASCPQKMSFQENPSTELVCLYKKIRDLKQKEYSPEEVEFMLRIPQSYPKMVNNIVDILNHYEDINHLFPGGMESYLDLATQICNATKKHNSAALIWMTKAFMPQYTGRRDLAPKKNIRQYHNENLKILNKYGDSASYVFQIDEFENSKIAIEEDFEQYKRVLSMACEKMDLLKFPLRDQEDGRNHILELHLKYWSGEEFESFRNGLGTVIEGINKAEQQSYGKRSFPSEVLMAYKDTVSTIILLKDLGDGYDELVPPFDYNGAAEAALLFFYQLDLNDMEQQAIYSYLQIREAGLDHNNAICIAGSIFTTTNSDIIQLIETYPPSIDAYQLFELATHIQIVHSITNFCESKLIDGKTITGNQLKIIQSALETAISKLKYVLSQPPFAGIIKYEDIDLELQVNYIQKKLYARKILSLGIVTKPSLQHSKFFKNTNPATQAAITGASFLAAIGTPIDAKHTTKDNDIPILLPEERRKLVLRGEESLETIKALSKEHLFSKIQRNMNLLIPRIEQIVLQKRADTAGLLSVGLKLHGNKKIAVEQSLALLQDTTGAYSTPFRLLHSGKTMNYPPLPTGYELALLIHVHHALELISADEIQTTIVGRWSADIAAMVGASVLLTTEKAATYTKKSFNSNGWEDICESRILIPDPQHSGVRINDLPFDRPQAPGRTDMLGRLIASDIELYRILGTLATDLQYNGPFKQVAEKYKKRFEFIIKQAGLTPTLRRSAWLFNPHNPLQGDSPENHTKMVNRFAKEWQKAQLAVDLGITEKIRAIVEQACYEMQEIQQQLIKDQPNELQKLMTY